MFFYVFTVGDSLINPGLYFKKKTKKKQKHHAMPEFQKQAVVNSWVSIQRLPPSEATFDG